MPKFFENKKLKFHADPLSKNNFIAATRTLTNHNFFNSSDNALICVINSFNLTCNENKTVVSLRQENKELKNIYDKEGIQEAGILNQLKKKVFLEDASLPRRKLPKKKSVVEKLPTHFFKNQAKELLFISDKNGSQFYFCAA